MNLLTKKNKEANKEQQSLYIAEYYDNCMSTEFGRFSDFSKLIFWGAEDRVTTVRYYLGAEMYDKLMSGDIDPNVAATILAHMYWQDIEELIQRNEDAKEENKEFPNMQTPLHEIRLEDDSTEYKDGVWIDGIYFDSEDIIFDAAAASIGQELYEAKQAELSDNQNQKDNHND